jgi:hypothetical protein
MGSRPDLIFAEHIAQEQSTSFVRPDHLDARLADLGAM